MKAAFVALCIASILSGQPRLNGIWPESSPESQGMDSSELAKLLDYIRKEAKGLDSLLIIRHGYLVLEVYYAPYNRDKEHILNSVTKSFVSALVGIAIDTKYISSDTSTLLDWFPELGDSGKYPGKAENQGTRPPDHDFGNRLAAVWKEQRLQPDGSEPKLGSVRFEPSHGIEPG